MWTLWLALALAETDGTRATVLLVPFGDFPPELEQRVGRAVAEELQVEIVYHASVALPRSAWYSPRQRWRAEKLLDFLDGQVPQSLPSGTRVLGLTTQDISTTKDDIEDWGIFGLGALGGRSAVVSTFRLRRNVDAARFEHRVTTIAIHEVGHALGLPHCTESGCLMQDAEGSIENTDESDGHLRTGCRDRLERR